MASIWLLVRSVLGPHETANHPHLVWILSLRDLLRDFLWHKGYVLWKRDYFRFGISPFADVERLNRAWGRSVSNVFDVGANVGQFMRTVRKEWPHVLIYCFEPFPESFAKLDVSKGTARAYPLALSDRKGEATFFVYAEEGDGSLINSLVPDARFPTRFSHQSREISVHTETIDSFCLAEEVERIDFLKIDVEGAEMSVLKGAEDMLSRGKVLAVYFEFNDLEPLAGTSGGALMPIAHYLGLFGLRYVCSYTDALLQGDQLHVVANALFVLPAVPVSTP